MREAPRHELDRVTSGAVHQGMALVVPPYQYADPHDLLQLALDEGTSGLIVALDGVTDPHNLGAIVRSAAAFGAQGVLIPERRAAGITATAWKTSAGAVARVPVARATNLTRTLKSYAEAASRSSDWPASRSCHWTTSRPRPTRWSSSSARRERA
jgi:23S rRNA (guanosine2251-2'-O)-methyltransferase